jgi:hypothetical protein
MKKIKEMFKKYVENFIIKHSEFFEKYYNDVALGTIGLFMLTAFIGSIVHAPKLMCTILLVELLLMTALIHFSDYVEEILNRD